MIKIGIFAQQPNPYQLPLWRELSKVADLSVRVFYFSHSTGIYSSYGRADLEGYDYEFIKGKGKPPNSIIPHPDDFFKRERFDIVLINNYRGRCERQIRKYSQKYNFKVIFRGEITHMEASNLMGRSMVKHFYLRWFYSEIDAFCPVGHDAERHLQSKGIPEWKLFFSPNSIDDKAVERQKSIYKQEKVREELGLRDSDIVFLFAGDLIKQNQPLMFAKACQELRDYPKLAVIFLGEGDLADEVENILRPIIGHRLIMPGKCKLDQAGYYFAASDVFVMPSEYCVWGLAVNLAMHWEKPVIVSDRCGCCRDLVIDGYTGYSHFYRDELSLTRYMRKFLTEPELAHKMGVAAYKEVKNYTMDKSIEGIVDAINYLYGRRILKLPSTD
jgi:glycosyltransferase involved in cell wall biosynthesis